MRKNFIKKNILLLTAFFSYIITPVKSLALEYTLLEPEAFESSITKTSSLGGFLSQAFSFGLALAAALAVIMIVWGGVEIMLSESVLKKSDGKERISNAIWGLILALSSYLILYTINPDILNFKL